MAFEDIIIRMGMDASAFNRALQSAKVQAKGLNSALGVVGMAVSGVGLAMMAAKTVEYGGKISDLSTRLGVSTDALQEFDFAARQNGSSLEEFAGGLQKVGNARSAALGGNEEMLNSFAALGVSMEDLKSKRIEDIFKQIGRSVRDASDVQLVMADAMKVMGKASGPILAAMRNDLEAAGEEAKRLGLIIGEDTIAKLDALGDQADVTGKRLMGAFAPFISFVGEGINTMLDGFQSVWVLLKRTAEMIDSMPTKGFSQAFEDASAGVSSDLAKIAAGQDARRNPAAKTGTGATDFESELKRAAEIVTLKEKLAEADAKALGIAAQRKKVEEDIAKLKVEQLKAGDAAAEKAKKELPAKIAALEKQRDEIPDTAAVKKRAPIEKEIAELKALPEPVDNKAKAERAAKIAALEKQRDAIVVPKPTKPAASPMQEAKRLKDEGGQSKQDAMDEIERLKKQAEDLLTQDNTGETPQQAEKRVQQVDQIFKQVDAKQNVANQAGNIRMEMEAAIEREEIEKKIAFLKALPPAVGEEKDNRTAELLKLEAKQKRIPAPEPMLLNSDTLAANKMVAIDALQKANELRAKSRELMGRQDPESLDSRRSEAADLSAAAKKLETIAARAVSTTYKDEVAAAVKRAEIEKEIAKLKKDAAAALPAEKGALERKIKEKELEAKRAGLLKQQAAAQAKLDTMEKTREQAVNDVAKAKGERSKFTLAELAGANLRNVADPVLRGDIIKAREALQLEQQGERIRQSGRVGFFEQSQEAFSKAEKIRAGITSATESERFPFQSLDAGIKSIDESIDLLLSQAKNDGLVVQLKMRR